MNRIIDVADKVVERGDVAWEETNGRVVVRRRRFGPVAAAILKPFKVPADLTIRLDALGSAAWLLLDGRTVAQVLEGLEESFPDEEHLAERLGVFLGTLVSNRLARFR